MIEKGWLEKGRWIYNIKRGSRIVTRKPSEEVENIPEQERKEKIE